MSRYRRPKNPQFSLPFQSFRLATAAEGEGWTRGRLRGGLPSWEDLLEFPVRVLLRALRELRLKDGLRMFHREPRMWTPYLLTPSGVW